jgi:hypothetical protein
MFGGRAAHSAVNIGLLVILRREGIACVARLNCVRSEPLFRGGRGIINFTVESGSERMPCCIAFDANRAGSGFRFTFDGAPQTVFGTYSETDLFFFSFWMGSDQFGNDFSGVSYLSFLHFFNFTSNQSSGGNATAVTFITPGSDCPPAQ